MDGLIGIVPLETQYTGSSRVIGIVFHDKRYFNPGYNCSE
jgi:hypothetical protein